MLQILGVKQGDSPCEMLRIKGEGDTFAHMKPITSFLTKILYGSLAVACMIGCTGGGQNETKPWGTGSADIDEMLDRVDSLEMIAPWDDAVVKATLHAVDSMASHGDGVNRQAAGLFVQSHLYEIDGDNDKAMEIIKEALGMVDSAKSPYLYSRLLLQRAVLDPELSSKTATYFNVLPTFIDARDSMVVVETLWELNNAYEYVWDDSTVLECFNEILKWVPDTMCNLKNIMRFNIIALERGDGTNPHYVGKIDSLRQDKNLIGLSPPLAVLVYSDLYRIQGDANDLDTAAMYMQGMVGDHDAVKVYYGQKLSNALKCGERDTAAHYAAALEGYLSDESPMIIETIKSLLPYYKAMGMTDKYDALNSRLAEMQTKAAAYEEATKMARMNTQRQMRDFRKYTTVKTHEEHTRVLWLTVGVLVVLFLTVGIIVFLQLRKRHLEAKARLHDDLENTKRRLTVAQLRAVENEQTLSNVLTDLGNISSEHNDVQSHADRIKVKLKAQLSGEDDWERFSAVFTEMRPGFVDKLRETYPVLTQGDIRLCCLLSMGLDTKHIARLLLIRPESVKKHRQRLRAKLGLSPEVVWTDYFAAF